MKRKTCTAGIVLFSVLFLISGFMLCRQYLDEKKSDDAFTELSQLVKKEPPISSDEKPEKEKPPDETAFDKYAELYALNDDLIGWISIDGTNIDYPVMQTKDAPDYYLKRNFERQYSDYGVPYVAQNCDIDISDNTVIYGHHMKNRTMFSDLVNYTSQSFYEEHKTIRFDTLGDFGEYEIIAVFKTPVYTENGFKYYQFIQAAEQKEFDAYIEQCKSLAFYDTGITAKYGDKLITLSTCEYSQQNGRLVVVAAKTIE